VGALGFFDTVNDRPKTVTHVALCDGLGNIITANSAGSGRVARVPLIGNSYWKPRLITVATI
jgi:hypothetical protein